MKQTFKQLDQQDQVKMLLYFFGCLDNFIEAHAQMEGTQLYRTELKNKSKALLNEIDKVQKHICTHPILKDVAYSGDWME